VKSVAIVGMSLAGLRAAEALRRGGFDGRIDAIGAEAHLPYDRPPLSKELLAGKWEPDDVILRKQGVDDLDLHWRLGCRAVALDLAARQVEIEGGDRVGFDGLVIATGSVPRRLPSLAGHLDGVFELRTLEDALAIRSRLEAAPRVVVIGAGFIGAEVASTCSGLGCSVSVIETLPVPLAPALGETVGGALGALHGRHGVDLRTETSVAALTSGANGDASIELSDGTTVEADVVVAGIGVVPEVSWLEGSGLTLDDGVVCDAGLFAADGVVAAGDLARWSFSGRLVRIEHWQMAADMGDAAAAALLAGRAAVPGFVPVPYFWSDQYGEKIQVLGRPSPDDEVVVVDGTLEERFVAIYRRGDRLSAAAAVSRPRQLMSYRALLAAGASFDEGLAASDPG
jgi:NADPH-dependent 2,4-dienoyl-CoA reductase/sulfur reductase-like enzyme